MLQETIIIKVKKTNQTPEEITITSSQSNNDFDKLSFLTVPYSLVVSRNDYHVYLVTDEEKVSVLERLHKFDKALLDYRVKDENWIDG